MKLSKNNSLSIATCGMLCLAACTLFSGRDSVQTMKEKPHVSSVTVTPDIPFEMQFCGDTVSLRRYNMHEGMDRELTSFCYFHSTTMLYLKRANQYFPIIEPILKEHGVPDDFKYLAVIESGLDPRIVSPARATGMWQFMLATAKQYGLHISPTVDERNHVEKATVAACKYLKDAYKRYGDWINVAASYNAGMGRISSELKKQQSDSALNLWLVEETRRYVYRIMAIKLVFENPYRYGFVLRPQTFYKPLTCKMVEVSKDISDLATFAKQHGVEYADLKRFNPWLRDRKLHTAGRTFQLKVPDKEALSYDAPNTYVHHGHWVVK